MRLATRRIELDGDKILTPLKSVRALNEQYFWWELLEEIGALLIHWFTPICDRIFRSN